jgi:3-oxoacyl-[acyl-carrier-protein] synthase II
MRDVVISGIGLVSSLAGGTDGHRALFTPGVQPIYDRQATAPFPVHPMAPLAYDRLIPKKADQRQMEPWQRIGAFAAGAALEDAGLLGNADLLSKTHMTVAAGAGERDFAVDEEIMLALRSAPDPDQLLNAHLSSNLRPTLFLAQLPNLLAGNISIVYGVIGSSRTLLGEEAAGFDAVATTAARIRSGEIDIGLVGGAYSAPRRDMLLLYGFCGALLRGEPAPLWSRASRGGGMILGSLGAFLVLESADHALKRGARIAAIVGPAVSERNRRASGAVAAVARKQWAEFEPKLRPGPVGVLSGASGAESATSEELSFLTELVHRRDALVRGTGGLIGHSIEATAPANIALAALALREHAYLAPMNDASLEREATSPPRQIVVTSFGFAVGEGMILLTAHGDGV